MPDDAQEIRTIPVHMLFSDLLKEYYDLSILKSNNANFLNERIASWLHSEHIATLPSNGANVLSSVWEVSIPSK